MVTIEKTPFAGWEDCLRLANDEVELVATTAVGPRILSFGFHDASDLFYRIEEECGKHDGDDWRMYGGHRLAHAPEGERTYVPDNDPLAVERHEDGVTLVQPTQERTGIRKEVEIRLADGEPEATIIHRLQNRNEWRIEFAPWAITVLDAGGTGVCPLSAGTTGDRLADRSITFWEYADPGDDRLALHSDGITLDSESSDNDEFKLGTAGNDEWLAYRRGNLAFRKRFDADPAATYPDHGCRVEVYTKDDFFEVETLGPLIGVEPGETVTHVERWDLLDDVENVPPAELPDVLAPD